MRYLLDELGYEHVTSSHSTRDVMLLFASRFVRMFAFGTIASILVLHLRLLGFSDQHVGLFLSLTLLGDVALSLIVTWTSDQLGRRRMLALGSILMGVSGVVFHSSGQFISLLLAAIIGIVSPSGNEVGPFSAIETGMLSQLVATESRVYVLMWYQFLGFIGTALGSLTTGTLVTSLERSGWPLLRAYRFVYILYSLSALVKVVLSLALTIYTEVDHPPIPVKRLDVSNSIAANTQRDAERQPLIATPPPTSSEVDAGSADSANLEVPSEQARKAPLPLFRLVLLSFLFAIDSFASSCVPNSFIAYYFRLAFDAPLSAITTTFSIGSLLGGFSQLLSGSIAKRLGIILTMVGTHIPAQILTMALAFAPTLRFGIALYLVRASIASMDAGVRGAFLSAIIPKESRTRFLGIINVCKTLASAPGPTLSGHLAASGGLRWSFVLCGALKITYDIGLLIGFQTHKLEH